MTNTTLSKWEQAISRLVEFTQDGRLEWQIVNSKEFLPNEDTSSAMLFVNYERQHLLLYRKAYMRVIPTNGLLSLYGSQKEVKDYRAELSVYEIDSKVVIYTFPYSELTDDLYRAATFNAAKVDELIDGILGDH